MFERILNENHGINVDIDIMYSLQEGAFDSIKTFLSNGKDKIAQFKVALIKRLKEKGGILQAFALITAIYSFFDVVGFTIGAFIAGIPVSAALSTYLPMVLSAAGLVFGVVLLLAFIVSSVQAAYDVSIGRKVESVGASTLGGVLKKAKELAKKMKDLYDKIGDKIKDVVMSPSQRKKYEENRKKIEKEYNFIYVVV